MNQRFVTSRALDRATGGEFTRAQISLILLGLALLIALRLPNAWVHGRFQDEEATVFFAYAWHFPWQEALLRPFGGYLNIAASATTLLLARAVQLGLLPLEHAPYVTMVIGLVSQILPAFLLLTAKAEWLTNRTVRLAGVLFIAVAPTTEEVFLNVMHVQFHLALSVALILAVDVPKRRAMRFLYAVPLILGPLCGPGAITFIPLFAARAFIERHPARWSQVLLLGAASMVQMLLFYSQSPVRSTPPDLVTTAAIMFLRLVALPLVGSGNAGPLGHHLLDTRVTGMTQTWLLALLAIFVLGSLLIISYKRSKAAFWLVSGAILVCFSTLMGGIQFGNNNFYVYANGRYNYLSLIPLFWGVLALFVATRGMPRALFCSFSVLILAVGVMQYPIRIPIYGSGPSWPDEVAKWRENPDYRLRVWPKEYVVDLSNRATSCPPPVAPGDPRAPRYCEAGWMTIFYRVEN